MMEAVNLTHRVERAVLEQRLEDAEQNLAIRDLQLDWMSFKAVYGGQDDTDRVADSASRPDHGQYYGNSPQPRHVVVGEFAYVRWQCQRIFPPCCGASSKKFSLCDIAFCLSLYLGHHCSDFTGSISNQCTVGG